MADIVFDINSTVQFVVTGNFKFAMVSYIICAASFSQQLERAQAHDLLATVQESLAAGKKSDALQKILISEKMVEAPLQLLLQYYTLSFISTNDFAMCSIAASLGLSAISVADAVWSTETLELTDELLRT